MKKSITSNPKLKYFTFSSQKKFNFKKALICKCAQQAFWSADKRNGREAVENRTA